MTSEAEEQKKTVEEKSESWKQWQQLAICAHMGMNVTAMCTLVPARPMIAAELHGSGFDIRQIAQVLASWTSSVGIVEFIISPTVGRLSDQYGRKMFLMTGPMISVVLKLNAYFNPSLNSLMLQRVVSGATTTVSGSTVCGASLSDMATSPAELAQSLGSMGTAAGCGVLMGPLLGGTVAARYGPQSVLLLGAGISAVQVLLVQSQVQETLVAENSKAFDWSAPFANPLSFLKLFKQSRVLTTFCLAGALQCCCEGKVVSDTNALYLIADAKFSIQKRSFWLACFGACMALAGRLSKLTLSSLGTKGHTTLANLSTAVAMTLLGSGTRWWQIWGCLALFPWSMERRVATMTTGRG